MSMWVLFIWMLGGYNGNSPSLATQEFTSESACKKAFAEVKKVNEGEAYLRGACAPKD